MLGLSRNQSVCVGHCRRATLPPTGVEIKTPQKGRREALAATVA